jgi:peptidoglycan hydrolase-like protein with peptidoglycan-binding domain
MAASSLLVPLAIVVSPGTALASGCNSNAVGSWSNNCTLVEGDDSNLVIGLQEWIDSNGTCGQIATDGSFGPATLTAVKCTQTFLGVTADGSVGPITWSAMQADLIKVRTSGSEEYWGTEAGSAVFGENTSSKAWETYDGDGGAHWVTM